MIFFSLPDVLLFSVLSDWIELKNLMKFESSMTNENHRHALQKMYSDEHFSISCLREINNCVLSWVLKRALSFRKLICDCEPDLILQNLQTLSFSKTTEILIHFRNIDWIPLLNVCSALSSLVMSGADKTFFPSAFQKLSPNILKNIVELDLSYPQFKIDTQNEVFTHIAEHCCQLQSLTLYFTNSPVQESKCCDFDIKRLLLNNPQLSVMIICGAAVTTEATTYIVQHKQLSDCYFKVESFQALKYFWNWAQEKSSFIEHLCVSFDSINSFTHIYTTNSTTLELDFNFESKLTRDLLNWLINTNNYTELVIYRHFISMPDLIHCINHTKSKLEKITWDNEKIIITEDTIEKLLKCRPNLYIHVNLPIGKTKQMFVNLEEKFSNNVQFFEEK
jgi:hypothetical protein